jgi:hypothetical protein
MYINRTLKTELQRLAVGQGQTNFTKFVCKEIKDLLGERRTLAKGGSLPPRAPRGAYLLMWVDADRR